MKFQSPIGQWHRSDDNEEGCPGNSLGEGPPSRAVQYGQPGGHHVSLPKPSSGLGLTEKAPRGAPWFASGGPSYQQTRPWKKKQPGKWEKEKGSTKSRMGIRASWAALSREDLGAMRATTGLPREGGEEEGEAIFTPPADLDLLTGGESLSLAVRLDRAMKKCHVFLGKCGRREVVKECG
ncbi:hypothetical protein LIER_33353 [Lithospermum erythrorhizon]|uniref:Uncharacterized protein n=1 Tax=Lithospermum erythrorhizon TaxID=34254 RepID=A0AAV3RZV4_LITER